MSKSDYQFLEKHRKIWREKAILRRVYQEQFYAPLIKNLADGHNNLEIGSGPGFIQEIEPSIIRSDIIESPWINSALDAHHLPFADSSVDNILGIDVLHHFTQPIKVMREASRVLRVGGRFLLVEPWITPFSRFIYTYLHQEVCDLDIEPWLESDLFGSGKDAFDGNAAIPYVLLSEGQSALEQSLPELQLLTLRPHSLFTYLLSGGFKSFNLLPNFLYNAAYSLENMTYPFWASMGSLRALIIWEKR